MNSRPLILLHGLCASKDVWHPLVERLAIQHRFDIHLFDYPLHFESTNFSEIINYFQQRVESLNIKDGILCGHSLGAHLAIRLGELFPLMDLILIQCSPAQCLQDLYSYFKPSAALQYLYQENWNITEQEIIESHLFRSFEPGKKQLKNESWSHFRRDLALDLNHAPFPDEITLLNNRHSKTSLVLNSYDSLLDTDLIAHKMRQMVPTLNIVQALGREHYAFFDSFMEWFGVEVEACFDDMSSHRNNR